jgi:hypothetical protein
MSPASVNLTTTATTYSTTCTVPSNCQEFAVTFYYLSSGTAGAADYFEITNVQLEVGVSATTFDYRPYTTELQLCQRYYLAVASGTLAYGRGNGTGGTVCSMPTPVTMRTAPSLPSTSSAVLYSVAGYSGSVTATWSFVTLFNNSVNFQGSGFSGGTDNRPNITEVASGFYFNAEL